MSKGTCKIVDDVKPSSVTPTKSLEKLALVTRALGGNGIVLDTFKVLTITHDTKAVSKLQARVCSCV